MEPLEIMNYLKLRQIERNSRFRWEDAVALLMAGIIIGFICGVAFAGFVARVS